MQNKHNLVWTYDDKLLAPKNIIVTPFYIRAWNSHYKIYNFLYPFPLRLVFQNGTISLHIDNVLKSKYIPFLLAQFVITWIIGFGSCIFLLWLKLFNPSANIGILPCVICVFLGCCAFLECSIYLVCGFGTEIETLINQLFHIERTCKFLIN